MMDKQRLPGWLRYGANAAFQNADTDMSLDERVRLLIAHEHPTTLEIENFRIGWLREREKDRDLAREFTADSRRVSREGRHTSAVWPNGKE